MKITQNERERDRADRQHRRKSKVVLAAKYTVVVFCCNAHATGCVTLHMDDAIESHVMVQQASTI